MFFTAKIDNIYIQPSGFFNYTGGAVENYDFFFIYAVYNPTNWTIKLNTTYFSDIKLNGEPFSGDTWTPSYYQSGTSTWTAKIKIQKN